MLQSQVQGNLPCLNTEVEKMSPAEEGKVSRTSVKPSACC